MDTQLQSLLQTVRTIEDSIVKSNSDLDAANKAVVDYVNANYPTLQIKK